MLMETHVYEALVIKKARALEEETGQQISHGGDGACPGCGHAGVYDLNGFGVAASSIYFSTAVDKWRCMCCEIDSYGC